MHAHLPFSRAPGQPCLSPEPCFWWNCRHVERRFPAGVQPRWIQGIRRVDGVGEERLIY